mmetsp:Transcript_54224/g.143991  ORF Transcript_54224/g.143991 Transcript_54224/m.143991 type:complete len:117 (-) Transcript_54224:29-379(-)
MPQTDLPFTAHFAHRFEAAAWHGGTAADDCSDSGRNPLRAHSLGFLSSESARTSFLSYRRHRRRITADLKVHQLRASANEYSTYACPTWRTAAAREQRSSGTACERQGVTIVITRV